MRDLVDLGGYESDCGEGKQTELHVQILPLAQMLFEHFNRREWKEGICIMQNVHSGIGYVK